MPAPPKVFISYTWEDDAHNKWVERFATALRGRGVEATIDKWELAPGSPLPAFMETEIRESRFVLLICTPKYKVRYDERKGGAGFEAHLVGGDTLVHGRHKKFIPILRHPEEAEAVPTAHQGKMYIDLRNDDNLAGSAFETLVAHIHGAAIGGGPPIVPYAPSSAARAPPSKAPASATEHDQRCFEKLDAILDESSFVGVVDWIGDQACARDEHLDGLVAFRAFISLTQNGFLDSGVESTKVELLGRMSELMTFISTHFFRRHGGPASTDKLLYLYPDLNLDLNAIATGDQQDRFHRRNAELGALCDDVIEVYRKFRVTVKKALFV